jgi:hypothetical protein
MTRDDLPRNRKNKLYHMKKTVFIILTVFAVQMHLSISSSAQTVKGYNDAEYKKGKTTALFNGDNLDGWYVFLRDRGRDNDPKQVFTVQDNMIKISGEEWGCITTEKEYKNYKIAVEFKWGEETHGTRADKARDSGLLVHSKGKDGAYSGIWMNSIEVQIIEGGTGDFIVVGDGTDKFQISSPVAEEMQGSSHVFQPGGDLVTINRGRINWWGRDPGWKDAIDFRGAKDVEKPVGEWNLLECIVVGDDVTVYLNGTLVNHATNVKPKKGRIQIQSEGAEMWVRKAELTSLSKMN